MKIHTTYQSSYFIHDFIQGVLKNPKIKEIQQVQQKIYTKQVWTLEISCFYVILHLNLKWLGFTGEPVTHCTCQSSMNVIHVRMWRNSLKHHATSCYIESYHDSCHNPNANPKMEHDIHEMSQSVTGGSWTCPLTKLLMGFKCTAIFCLVTTIQSHKMFLATTAKWKQFGSWNKIQSHS